MNFTQQGNQGTSIRICSIESSNIADLMRIADETNLSPWSAQNYLDEMKNPASIMFRVVDEDNLTVGFVVGRVVPGTADQVAEVEETPLDAEIYNIALKECEHGKGLGQYLFDTFISVCRQKAVANIWLEVRESNQKAIAFYERNDFSRVQTRNHFYENPREHAILMKRNLWLANSSVQ